MKEIELIRLAESTIAFLYIVLKYFSSSGDFLAAARCGIVENGEISVDCVSWSHSFNTHVIIYVLSPIVLGNYWTTTERVAIVNQPRWRVNAVVNQPTIFICTNKVHFLYYTLHGTETQAFTAQWPMTLMMMHFTGSKHQLNSRTTRRRYRSSR